ncbi:MAG: EI24 domain-containing protein [Lentisphaeraceae bacterium]|nr:EI24 domain-containing protein [Lentisphaeraceae bacterium]
MGTDQTTPPTYDFLDKNCREVNGLMLLHKGQKAFKEVPGLYKFYLKGVFVTLLCALAIFIGLFFTLYRMWILPELTHYLDAINNWSGWLSYLTIPFYWLLIIITWSGLVYLSLKLSVFVLSMWIDTLLEKIMTHFRGIPEKPFNTKRMIKVFLAGLKLSLGNMLLSLFFFVLGLIPIIGPFMTFAGLSCSSGFDIKTPYIMLLGEDAPEKYKEFKLKKGRLFKIGFIHGAVSFIPVVGWILLPASLLLQMAGYTFFCEEKWQARQKLLESL